MNAASAGEVDTIKALIQRGADPNVLAVDGWNALCIAAREGHLQAVDLLLRSGAKIDGPEGGVTLRSSGLPSTITASLFNCSCLSAQISIKSQKVQVENHRFTWRYDSITRKPQISYVRLGQENNTYFGAASRRELRKERSKFVHFWTVSPR